MGNINIVPLAIFIAINAIIFQFEYATILFFFEFKYATIFATADKFFFSFHIYDQMGDLSKQFSHSISFMAAKVQNVIVMADVQLKIFGIEFIMISINDKCTRKLIS